MVVCKFEIKDFNVSPAESTFDLVEHRLCNTQCEVYTNREIVQRIDISIQPIIFVKKIDGEWVSAQYYISINPTDDEHIERFKRDVHNFVLLYCDEIEKVCSLFLKEKDLLEG